MIRNFFYITAVFLLITVACRAQISSGNYRLLAEKEAPLRELAAQIVEAPEVSQRVEACKTFIPGLIAALKTKGSFYYPFDSLQQISIVYAPDSTFRIFTWALPMELGAYRYYGTLQMRTPDNSLRMYPFFDYNNRIQNTDTITASNAWIGCLYYNIIKKEYKGHPLYTLFGWQGNNFRSNKKLLEALTFRDGRPVFGAPVFSFQKDSVPGGVRNRFFIEYKEDGNASMNYDPELEMIVFDHLVPINGEPQKKYTLVPDGSYEGFKWEKSAWVHVGKIFDEVSKKPPVPAPLEFKKNILEKDTMRVNR